MFLKVQYAACTQPIALGEELSFMPICCRAFLRTEHPALRQSYTFPAKRLPSNRTGYELQNAQGRKSSSGESEAQKDDTLARRVENKEGDAPVGKDHQRVTTPLSPLSRHRFRMLPYGYFIDYEALLGAARERSAQERRLNRGWSPQGKVYRQMERLCYEQGGTFCFSRPIYTDVTNVPRWIEFGVLKTIEALWVEVFEN